MGFFLLQMSPEWLALICALTDLDELVNFATLMGVADEPEIIERINELTNSSTPQQDCDDSSLLDEITSSPLVSEPIGIF